MAGMNAPLPSDSQAFDLSALKKDAPAAGASYVVEVDDTTFEAMLSKSTQHPIIVEFYSPRANAQQLSDDLAALANAAAGKYLLARVNVDQARVVAQALGIQAVPMVVGVLGGQMAPLFQGTRSKADAEAVINQLMQAAVANGVVGRAKPVEVTESGEPAPDPRFAAADAALAAGDFAKAEAEFDTILAATPNDAEALSGRAQVRLLRRLQAVPDPAAVVTNAGEDVDSQLLLADLEVGSRQVEAGFERLVNQVRLTAGADRDRVRARLLELFEAVGASDPAVLKARRDLMSALF